MSPITPFIPACVIPFILMPVSLGKTELVSFHVLPKINKSKNCIPLQIGSDPVQIPSEPQTLVVGVDKLNPELQM